MAVFKPTKRVVFITSLPDLSFEVIIPIPVEVWKAGLREVHLRMEDGSILFRLSEKEALEEVKDRIQRLYRHWYRYEGAKAAAKLFSGRIRKKSIK